jgi:hypothetical protein
MFYRPEMEERRKSGQKKGNRSENEHYPLRIKSAPGGNRTRGLQGWRFSSLFFLLSIWTENSKI